MEPLSYREEELPSIASKILAAFPDYRIFCFEGDLGAGKTTLIKALCAHLTVTDNVSSPSYGIIHEYRTTEEASVYHFDFYRLKNVEEAYDLGCEEYFYSGNYCFIEWPEKILNLLQEQYVWVSIRRDFLVCKLSAKVC